MALARIVALLFLCCGCERIVEINVPLDELKPQCTTDGVFDGRWISDSVTITSVVDTVDSLIENQQPTVVYWLTIQCADSSRLFELTYANFSGVFTTDVSTNRFSCADSGCLAFGTDSLNADFTLSLEPLTDTTCLARFQQQPNGGQVTKYMLYLRRIAF